MPSSFGLKSKILLATICAMSLAACDGLQPDPENTVTVTPKAAGSQGIDVYAAQRSRGGPTYYGERTITVRVGTVIAPEVGPRCVLSNALFEANFVAPAFVRLPDYRRDSPTARIRCEFGDRVGEATLEPINISAARRQGAMAAPLGTGLAITIPIGPANRPDDIWGYPPVVDVYLQ